MIREAQLADVDKIWSLVLELAEYERLLSHVTGSPELLAKHLFETQACRCYVVEHENEIVGYALTFTTFSTFRMQPGLWLEDLYVSPDMRGRGYGKALLRFLAGEVQRLGYGRLEWAVLDWNEPSIQFYKALGAKTMDDWITCRVSGDSLAALATRPQSL